MIDTPVICETRAQLVAMIHLTIPRSEIRAAMGPALAELRAAIEAAGMEASGPWFTHHLSTNAERFDFEVCIPVPGPVEARGRVACREMPAVTVARTTFSGSYEGLASGWGELARWMSANGHAPAADFYECYVAGPEKSSDPAAWRTELSRPLSQS